MNAAMLDAPKQDSLVVVARHLQEMMDRLRCIIEQRRLSDETLVEIMTIFNNVAYIFLYLEANEEHIDYTDIKPWFAAFYKDRKLDECILAMLMEFRCDDPGIEQSRRAYMEQLQERVRRIDGTQQEDIKRLQQEIKESLYRLEADQRAILAKLKLTTAPEEVASTFYILQSCTASPESRERLETAWQQIRDHHAPRLTGLVDAMVAQRRVAARRTGFPSVLARTLERCRVNDADIEPFMAAYIGDAIDAHQQLLSAIGVQLGLTIPSMAHFGHYLRRCFDTNSLPAFYLNDCIDYMLAVAERVFGLTFRRNDAETPLVLALEVRRDDELAGRINLDLWDSTRKRGAANHTKSIRNRACWGPFRQLPVAYVSCRFARHEGANRRISFQNVHSLFHEFGHAINHLLIKGQIPNQSGLEYLPLERLEYLSLWFEKWIYHPDFPHRMSGREEAADQIETCRQIKKLEYRRTLLERAVTAYLDFDLHRGGQRCLVECFAQLDARFGIGRFCRFSDFLGYFARPMFIANPGANFIYLWGEAASCELYAPFAATPLSDIVMSQEAVAAFSPCFEFELSSATPSPRSLFNFYGCANVDAAASARIRRMTL